jgi:hypothetical protein
MSFRNKSSVMSCCLLAISAAAGVPVEAAQPPAPAYVPEDHRPPLFFRETFPLPEDRSVNWHLNPSQTPLSNSNLQFKQYGEIQTSTRPHDTKAPDHGGLELVRRPSPKDDPTFVYWGSCFKPCAFTLRDKTNAIDLTGMAKIKWRSWQTGFHELRPIVKLADGTWLVGDYVERAAGDWNEREFAVLDIRWKRFSAEKVVTAMEDAWVQNPDLSKVDEIGVADLMPGNVAENGHGRASTARLDWIEVWGVPVKR